MLLAGATPADDILLDGARSHFVPSGAPTHVLDMDTGDHRASTLEDQRQSAIVADAMPVVDVMWMLVSATDVPDDQRVLQGHATSLLWSDKHCQDEVADVWQVEPVMRMMEVVCGSLEEFRRRPRASVVCCTSSPLAVGTGLLDATLAIAPYGMPVLIYPHAHRRRHRADHRGRDGGDGRRRVPRCQRADPARRPRHAGHLRRGERACST